MTITPNGKVYGCRACKKGKLTPAFKQLAFDIYDGDAEAR